MRFFIPLLIILLSCFSGCMQEEPAPKILTDTPVAKNIETNNSLSEDTKPAKAKEHTLTVQSVEGARVRILNIKPKYHDGMQLKSGKYLIEVTKRGYKKYKKWINLEDDLVLHISLSKNKNPYDTQYFKYVTKIEWESHHDLFTLEYDSKNKLIWALQSAYVDYVKQKYPKRILKNTLYAKGTPWPKIYETKIDTLIYTGYFRYRGRNFLFKNKNSITLYKAGKKEQKAKRVAHLSKLEVNSMVQYWRLPKEKELLRANPFAKYQKYFQVSYSRYKNVTFNLPILCTKLKKGSYYSNCSVVYTYNEKTGLYDGKRINQAKHIDAKDGLYFALNHAKNFALVTPVRAISTRYDKIIFDTRINGEQKLAALTTLLIQESLQKKKQKVKNIANMMASKAMHMIFGDPKVSGRKLYASSNDFSRVLKRKRKTVAKAIFRVKNQKLYLSALK
ncbi:hypothetical protein [Sulfurimonas indica]|uniref:hypothetical protein n=1 Tax=Sulfurimonas indica TaxID=2508707 RepID=UPI0012659E16|nr:hypothetical protein [Sulfurimonas indica]